MFGLFRKKTKADKLQIQYEQLLEESFELSTKNRSQSDAKAAEADEVMKKLEKLRQ